MPSTTVVGGAGHPPVIFTHADAASYGQALANALSALLDDNALAAYTYSSSDETSVDPTTPTAVYFDDETTDGTVMLGSDVKAVIDDAASSTDGTIEVSMLTPVEIAGGAPGISVLAGSGGLTFTDITASGSLTDTIVAGDGANNIQTSLVDDTTGNYVVNTGAGDDTIGIFNGSATINAATGHNLVVLGGGANSGNSFVYSEGADSIVGNTVVGGQTGTGGTDTVDIGSGQTTINPGSSNFFVFGNQYNTLTLLIGTGSDTIQVGAGGGTVTGGLGGNNILIGGADTASVTWLYGTQHGDQLFATGSGSVVLAAGAGNETLSGAGGSPLGTALGASTGNDTLIAGTGNASMVGGAGTDIFEFTKGQAGGSDTITGFKATDTLQLNGYGLTATAVLNSAVSVGGSTTLTLNDGTTVLFADTSNINAAQIKIT